MDMDLKGLHEQVKDTIASLDLQRIWPGFLPLRFALYDDERCVFDGRDVPKTDDFCANTSIVYQGEQIAIWKIQQEMDISVLTSKIVHEMFHGYQARTGWDCWPNELEALYRYRYDGEDLGLKLRENELLLMLLEERNDAVLGELLALRKLRSLRSPYEFSYESHVEEIEGTANYVEWQVLKQLHESRAKELEAHMRSVLTTPEAMVPIRISCYASGALTIHSLREAGRYSFEPVVRPVICSALEGVLPWDGAFPGRADRIRRLTDTVAAFHAETEKIIHAALEQDRVVLQGPATLVGLNVYNARCYQGFLTSTYFLMYRQEDTDKLLHGDFVIQMQDESTIAAVYQWI